MNSRKLIALFLVFALTGSALAAQQQRLYEGSDDGDLEASGVVGVQQHSVFIEIVIEKEQEDKEIHEFAAVVGLIKECKKVRNVFDNAVLWFNDQFLFGEKDNQPRNVTVNDSAALGWNPDEPGSEPGENPFIGTEETGDPRWGGCYTPDGFAHAIGSDDPFGYASVEFQNESAEGPDHNYPDGPFGVSTPDDNMDVVKEMINLDNSCGGCIFEYDSSFFVVDPNDNRWIVDKYVYPLSVYGNFFAPGNCDANGGNSTAEEIFADDPGTDFTPDPRVDPRSNHHASTCTDESEDDQENHEDGSDGSSTDLYEPLFTTHLQVEPTDTGLGFEDNAAYADSGNQYDGAPYPGTEDRCDEADRTCSIEYNFLLAVDFSSFDNQGPAYDDSQQPDDAPQQNTTARAGNAGEDEIDRGCAVEHGDGGADNQTSGANEFWQGNSHPHNPQTNDGGPQHCHPAVNLDIFFHDQAPYYTMDNQYWSDDAGTPVDWTANCQSEVGNEGSEDPVSVRTPLVCDYDDDAGEFHAHDGSETIRPSD